MYTGKIFRLTLNMGRVLCKTFLTLLKTLVLQKILVDLVAYRRYRCY